MRMISFTLMFLDSLIIFPNLKYPYLCHVKTKRMWVVTKEAEHLKPFEYQL